MLGDGWVIAMRVRGVGIAATVALACSSDAPPPVRVDRSTQRCDAANVSTTIDSAGIGPVLRGARVSQLATRCTVSDTAIAMEGTPERAHIVRVGSRSLVALSSGTSDTSIVRVITTDPGFHTAGGVGVGSSVQSLRLAHGGLCAARGEGLFVVMAANLPGVSFAIDWNPPATLEASPFPGGDPGTALDAQRITRVWVHGVLGACRVSVS
jgi:hypothetical protein